MDFSFLTQLNEFAIGIIVIILFILGFAFVNSIILRGRYKQLAKEILDPTHREDSKFKHETLNKIVDDYKVAAKRNKRDVNTQAIIEKHFDADFNSAFLQERFINKASGLMIILGLVGTFFGLTLSIAKLVELLKSSSDMAVETANFDIAGSLINSLSGMSVAFVTSLFGISGSIIITVSNIMFNVTHERVNVMVKMEEYLDNILAKDVLENIIVDSNGNVLAVGSDIDKFSNILDDSFKGITDTLSERLAAVTVEMAKTAEMIQKSVAMFDHSLQDFADNTRDFSEFNHHLKDNIQRMSLSFSDFGEEIKSSTDRIAKSEESIQEVASVLKLEKDNK